MIACFLEDEISSNEVPEAAFNLTPFMPALDGWEHYQLAGRRVITPTLNFENDSPKSGSRRRN
jgi:hypothetical protein